MYITSLHNGQTSIGNYGSVRTLTFSRTGRRQVSPKSFENCIRKPSAQVKTEIAHEGKRLHIIGTKGQSYIVLMPDRTYGLVDIRTEKFLGAY